MNNKVKIFMILTSLIAVISINSQVLNRIEDYTCDYYPGYEDGEREMYDVYLEEGMGVPPTKTDTFIYDIWNYIKGIAQEESSQIKISYEYVRLVIQSYRDNEWDQMPGYRPWTHWNFINGLSEDEAAVLMSDILNYIKANGIFGMGYIEVIDPTNTVDTIILQHIEDYTCAPYPISQYSTEEAYEWSVKYGQPVPETKTETFIYDIWQRIEMDLELDIRPEEINEDLVWQALQIYRNRNWEDIAGFRPWTFSHFINELSYGDEQLLITDIVNYIKTNGVYGEDEY